MNWDEWIELDNHYPKFHADKKRRIEERGSKCFHTDPSPQVFDGAVELLEELCGYLPERYPSMFRKTEHGMVNLFADETFDIRKDVLTMNGNREDPMQMAARMVQDDLAIMFEKEDGQMYLLAGAVLLAGFWRLQDKLGMSLDEIHYRFALTNHARFLILIRSQWRRAWLPRQTPQGHEQLLPPYQARSPSETQQLLPSSRRRPCMVLQHWIRRRWRTLMGYSRCQSRNRTPLLPL